MIDFRFAIPYRCEKYTMNTLEAIIVFTNLGSLVVIALACVGNAVFKRAVWQEQTRHNKAIEEILTQMSDRIVSTSER